MAQVSITLNGNRLRADSSETILDVARRNGIFIPTLCHDGRLDPIGSCRVCLVKVQGSRCFVPSCTTRVTEGMSIDTDDREVREARKLSLSLLISDHYGDCVSPCSLACPARIDIQGYIALISAGRYAEAVRLIMEKNPMPLTIGRVCPHPCEEVCRRSRVDEAIAINNLKRFAADRTPAGSPPKRKTKNRKIAVIGSGPAGLSCAYYLAISGYRVHIFEEQSEAGGMLRWGIPDYRLPKDLLKREIDSILDLGVELHLGKRFGKDPTVESLKKERFSALFLGIGAQKSIGLRIEGENDPRVLQGIEFLHHSAEGKAIDLSGRNVVVIGGGNTAMDAARSCIRFGAAEVRVLYRRTRKEMPANDAEIEEAVEEGVIFEYLAAPVRIRPSVEVLEIECIRMELGSPDASGRRRPVPIAGSEYSVFAHHLIAAVGQRTDATCIADPDLVSAHDTIKAHPETGTTHDDFVFAGGDCVTGAATAIQAIAGGRNAAVAIDRLLATGVKPAQAEGEFNVTRGTLEDIPDLYFELYERKKRVSMPREPASVRIRDFREIEHGLSEQAALREASRCLECGCSEGFSCLLRDHAAFYGVDGSEFPGEKNSYREHNNLLGGHPPIIRDENKCVKCGICVRICDEVWGLNIFGFQKRGFHTEIAPYLGLELKDTECDFCGQCAGACPTGALSLNSFLPKPGPFKAETRGGICTGCSLGCAVEYDVYENMLLRSGSDPTKGENGGNLCVRGRFGFGYLLTPPRTLDYLECEGMGKRKITRGAAVRMASDILKTARRPAVVTSTNLSNEEYEAVHRLGGLLNGAPVYHVPYDFADRRPGILPVAGKSSALEPLLTGIRSPDLSDIAKCETIVLFNITPGRSYPILEMTVRNAARGGSRLFIINETPVRLDDYAESVFRMKSMRYGEFLKTAGALACTASGSADEETVRYYDDIHPEPRLLADAGISERKIGSFLKSLLESGSVLFVTDEDLTSLEDFEAFIRLLRVVRGQRMLLSMQHGANPGGALGGMREPPQHFTLGSRSLSGCDALLLYKLPDLFDLAGIPVIHLGFSPFSRYGGRSLFVPASSLLETGGTTLLYNHRCVRVPDVLKPHRGVDNLDFISSVVERLKNV